MQQKNLKINSLATNGRLDKTTNGSKTKSKFAAAKRNNQEKCTGERTRAGFQKTKGTPNGNSRSEVQRRVLYRRVQDQELRR
jgi:hypothetical protein